MGLKELNVTISTLEGSRGLERAEYNSFYFRRLWWS